MPVEINELHVKIQLSEQNPAREMGGALKAKDKEEIIKSCVEAVLEILELRKKR